jgi:type 1 glutamine amidotransferase
VKRTLLWSGALGVLLIALVVQVRARRAARGPETCGGSSARAEPDTLTVRPSSFRVLVFTKHQGFSHRSIPAAVAAMHTLGARHGFTVLATEDPTLFADDALHAFAAVIFLNTTGYVLSEQQKAAFERYVHAGGGVVGIHSALDTEPGWAWYHRLLGADFAGHPPVQRAGLIVAAADGLRPPLPQPWERTDEWYNYRAVPESVSVLVSVDEGSYRGGRMGRRHPVTWYHDFGGGRAWYTAMGHTTCSFSEPPLLSHILGGILYAAQARKESPP